MAQGCSVGNGHSAWPLFAGLLIALLTLAPEPAQSEEIGWYLSGGNTPYASPGEICRAQRDQIAATYGAENVGGPQMIWKPPNPTLHYNCIVNYSTRHGSSFFMWTIVREGDTCRPNQVIDPRTGICIDKLAEMCFLNPVNPGTGYKSAVETDYRVNRPGGIRFQRYYAARYQEFGWTFDFQQFAEIITVDDPASSNTHIVIINRPRGGDISFSGSVADGFTTSADYFASLNAVTDAEDNITAWQFSSGDDIVEEFNLSGQLVAIRDANGNAQTVQYDADQRVSNVASNAGESLMLGYDVGDRLISLTDHAARQWHYLYDAGGNLEIVIHPDGTPADDTDNPKTRYHYDETGFVPANAGYSGALTGITDERGVRYATYEYDAQGRVIADYHANHAQRGDLTYDDANGTVTLANSRGVVSTYTRTVQNGVSLIADIAGPGCSTCGAGNTSYEYDPATNNLLAKTDNGLTTEYGSYDANGNAGFMIEAKGTPPQRRTDYTWDTRFFSKVQTITEPSVYGAANKTTSHSYDANGNRIQTTISGFTPSGIPVARTTSLEYNGPLNQLTRIDGPRVSVADITTFDYYPNDAAEGNNRARLKRVTSGGLVLRDNIQYTATGRVLSETRPNGLTLGYTYYPGNDRLEMLTETAGDIGKTTHWTYLSTGEVQSITTGHGTADATTLTFGYDDARRLMRITDGLGNYIQYTLDTEGNPTGEAIHDAANTLRKTLSRTFDVYNRVDVTTQANETLDSDFAPNGTLDKQTDGKGRITDYGYDSLKRLISVTQDLGGTDTGTQNALTQYGYDRQDNLTSVTAPNGGMTTYLYDDLGNLIVQTSPDTGAGTFVHDGAGNVIQQMDAKGQVFSYTYDALNRLTQLDAPGSADDVTYSYDTCTNGTGRLCSVTTATTSATYAYDGFGNVTRHQSVDYSYDDANRINTITYPSGNIVTYRYDAAGQISQVDLAQGATTTTLASNIRYTPFGPVETLTFGNGLPLNQTHDTAYRLTGQTAGSALAIAYTSYDANGNLQNRTIDGAAHTYQYDALNRLDIATGSFGTRDYGYDKNGNRLALNDGTASTSYSYTPNSNRMTGINTDTVGIDLNGNTYIKGDWSYSYTTTNRLNQVLQANQLIAGYDHNGLGQRVTKTRHNQTITGNPNQSDYNATVQAILGTGPGTSYSDCNNDGQINVQDLACLNNAISANTQGTTSTKNYTYGLNGELLAESGQTASEYIYLNGTPLAIIANSNIYYIHTDHLATPQKLTDATGTVVWSASYDPFGKATPNEDPDNNGTSVTFNLRFPGQYADAETGLHYNYFRTYDPGMGRYLTSDPIGLFGGLNTYGYADANPVLRIDPPGLWSTEAHDFFIDEAYPTIPKWVRSKIKAGSAHADAPHNQLCGRSGIHSMSCLPALPPDIARRQMEENIRRNMESFRKQYCRGNLSQAGFFLGMALHSVMDSTSPAHRDFQNWSFSAMQRHGDFPGSLENINAARQHKDETLTLMLDLFDPGSYDCECATK